MNHKTTMLTAAILVAALAACDSNAQNETSQVSAAPVAPTQEMEGHEMSKMQDKPMRGDMAGMQGHSAGSMEMHKIMMSGMDMPIPMSGNVDRDFATMMTMHHQQAIKMADVMIQQGSNAELKALAEKMKADQQAEIKQLAAYTK